MPAIIDISRPLSSRTAVWPGDRAVEPSWTARREDGSAVNVGALSLSLHAGTHADAPLHHDSEGDAVSQLPLSSFIGPAAVVDVTGVDVIRPADLRQQPVPLRARVLFKTSYSRVPTYEWRGDFSSVAPATIEWLSERGVVLVGTDAPSVDPADSTALEAHRALQRCGIVNLESLCLCGVTPGTYRLVALPLRIEGMDASPVRAVLFDEA